MCNQTCFSVDTFTFLYDDDDDDDEDDNDDEHYPILTHKNPYMGKREFGLAPSISSPFSSTLNEVPAIPESAQELRML